jgi:hypothetical protein
MVLGDNPARKEDNYLWVHQTNFRLQYYVTVAVSLPAGPIPVRLALAVVATTLIGSYALAQFDPGQLFSRKCASGYSCLFENREWTGRRLQFNVPGKIDLHD